MLDFHLHVWEHGPGTPTPTYDQLAAYCEAAAARGVDQIAITEHSHRFTRMAAEVLPHWERPRQGPLAEATDHAIAVEQGGDLAALEHLARYDAAESAYRKAVEARGDAVDYLAKGRLLLKRSRFEESKNCLEIAFKLGERVTSLELLKQLKAQQNAGRLKKVLTTISQFLNGKS